MLRPKALTPRYGRVTPEQQARYLPLAYQRVLDEWPWVGVANAWYLKRATDQWEQQGEARRLFPLACPRLHASASL